MNEKLSTWEMIGALSLTGLVIGLGQLLASEERLTTRIIIGRALSTVGLALSSGALLLWFTDVPILALIGVAAGLASLGTSFLEKFLQKKLGLIQ